MLSASAPDGFGFMKRRPAPIGFSGSKTVDETGILPLSVLAVLQGRTLSIVGGDVQIDRGTLQALGGRINLLSLRSPGQLLLDPASANSSTSLHSFAQLGSISLTNDSQLDLGDQGGGRVAVRGGNLLLNGASTILARSFADEQISSRGIDLRLSGTLLASGGSIIEAATSAGRDRGSIHLEADGVRITGGATIQADAHGSIGGGRIEVAARNVTLDGGSVVVDTGGLTAAAGDIRIRSAELRVVNGGSLSAQSTTQGGGSIDIRARQVLIDGGSSELTTSVEASGSETAAAGAVRIRASGLRLARGGEIQAGSSGNAGSVEIDARTVALDGGVNSNSTAIAANSVSDGKGGDIRIRAGSVRLTGGAVISASNGGAGTGGSIDVISGALLLEGHNPNAAVVPTEIIAGALGTTTARGGDIRASICTPPSASPSS